MAPEITSMGDIDDSTAHAATVVLVRDGERGLETFMIERPQRGSFAGAWVFPGGKVEDADRDEAFDEESVLRRAAVRETEEETGLLIAAEDLVGWAIWHPPAELPVRIRTWFFLAPAPDGVVRLQASEAVRGEWMRPDDMLALHAAGAAILFPPTWVTLQRLAAASRDGSDPLATLGDEGWSLFRSRITTRDGHHYFSWGEDDGGEQVEAGIRDRVDTASLPWRYETHRQWYRSAV